MPSGGILHVLSGFIPITRWLPKYKLSYLSNDAIAGLTVGVMSVPQGKVLIKTNQNNLSAMAYANLAGVAPVYGLYTSFFAPLFYMIFGTSRHISLGKSVVWTRNYGFNMAGLQSR
jgi:MFS superfamily sulfate permease-like transporter